MDQTEQTELGTLGLGPEMFRLMADHAPAMLWVADAAGRVIAYNRAWYDFTGRGPAQDEGDGWADLVHPEDRDAVERQWRETVIAGTACRSEYRLRRADGEYRWLLDDGRPVVDERGRLRGFVGSCRDITERRRATDELRASAAVLRDVAATVPGVLYQYEITGDGVRRYTYVSEGVRELLGVDPDWVMSDGMSLYGLVRPAQLTAMLEEGSAALREGRASRHEVEMRRADGTYVPVRIRASSSQREDGTRVWTGLIIDVAQERRVNAELVRSQERAQLALETAADALWDWNIQTGELYVAPRNLEMLGHDPADSPITRIEQWQALWHPDDRPEVERRMREHFEGRTAAYEFERRMRHRDGHFVWMLSRGRVVQRGPGGEPLRMIGTNLDLTDRRARDRALRQSEERFRTAFEHAPVGMVLQDVAGEIVRANPAMCEMTGYSEPEVVRLGITGLTHPDDQGVNKGPREELLRGVRVSQQYEKRYIHKSGRVLWVLVCVSVLTDESGQVTGFVGQVLDISAQKQAERALRESEERFRAAFEHAAVAMAMVDPDGKFTRMNTAHGALLGYAPEELLGRDVAHISYPADMAENMRLRTELAAGLIPAFHMEKRYLHKDGRLVWGYLSVAPLRDGAGVLTGFIAQILDISGQKAAEVALRDSVERFRVLAEMAPVGIFLADPRGRFTYANLKWLELCGLTQEQAAGEGWSDAVHAEDLERVRSRWYAATVGGGEFACEFRLVAPGGGESFVYATARPLRDHAGQIMGHLGTVTDVTGLKSAESRLRHSLEQREDLLRRGAALRRELDHRVRNNLAGLMGLVALYERSGRADGALGEALRGKILAMREVHEVITRSPELPVGLERLVVRLASQVLTPEQAAGVGVKGPPVQIPTAQAGAMAMIIQEFLTNARKHGSMSRPGGGIRVEWEATPGQEQTELRLVWSEFGGPPLAAPPGFGVGLKLVEGFAASEMRGGIEARFSREGFCCILRAKLAGSQMGVAGARPAEPNQ